MLRVSLYLVSLAFFTYYSCSPSSSTPPEIHPLSLHDALPICRPHHRQAHLQRSDPAPRGAEISGVEVLQIDGDLDRKSTRLNSSHVAISYAVFCLKKKKHRTY